MGDGVGPCLPERGQEFWGSNYSLFFFFQLHPIRLPTELTPISEPLQGFIVGMHLLIDGFHSKANFLATLFTLLPLIHLPSVFQHFVASSCLCCFFCPVYHHFREASGQRCDKCKHLRDFLLIFSSELLKSKYSRHSWHPAPSPLESLLQLQETASSKHGKRFPLKLLHHSTSLTEDFLQNHKSLLSPHQRYPRIAGDLTPQLTKNRNQWVYSQLSHTLVGLFWGILPSSSEVPRGTEPKLPLGVA